MRSRHRLGAYYPARARRPRRKASSSSRRPAARQAPGHPQLFEDPHTVVHEAFPGHDMQFWSFQRDPSISTVRHLTSLSASPTPQRRRLRSLRRGADAAPRFFTPKEELTQWAPSSGGLAHRLDVGIHTGEYTADEAAKALSKRPCSPGSIAAVEAYAVRPHPSRRPSPSAGRLQIETSRRLSQRPRRGLLGGRIPPCLPELRPVLRR